MAVSGLDAAPASHNTAALANWFRAAHINQVKLTPYGFHCQIGSRYALVTPDVRVLVAVVFVAVTKHPGSSPRAREREHLLLLGTSAEIFLPDTQETVSKSGGVCALATFICFGRRGGSR